MFSRLADSPNGPRPSFCLYLIFFLSRIITKNIYPRQNQDYNIYVMFSKPVPTSKRRVVSQSHSLTAVKNKALYCVHMRLFLGFV